MTLVRVFYIQNVVHLIWAKLGTKSFQIGILNDCDFRYFREVCEFLDSEDLTPLLRVNRFTSANYSLFYVVDIPCQNPEYIAAES
jgi:hypothetical protein